MMFKVQHINMYSKQKVIWKRKCLLIVSTCPGPENKGTYIYMQYKLVNGWERIATTTLMVDIVRPYTCRSNLNVTNVIIKELQYLSFSFLAVSISY